MKKLLLLISAVLLFCSYTEDEELAIEFIKSEYPNNVQIHKIVSKEYTWPYEDKGKEYEYFYQGERINSVDLKESTMIDSVSIYKKWFVEMKGTWTLTSFEHDFSGKGDFQQLSITLNVVDGKVYPLYLFVETREKRELYKAIRLDNPIEYKDINFAEYE